MARISLSILFCYLLYFLCVCELSARGIALVVGGGSERNTTLSWSTPAYSWAVNQSSNKRVLILGVLAPSDNWLASYFVNQCGARTAKDLTIGSDIADAQWVYDTIMAHDVVFIRGGDQSRYYTLWKTKKIEAALKNKWNSGGVLAGTSAGLHVLSQVIFTAQNASITSAEAIRNVQSGNITLVQDFISAVPNVLFDSHFAERGRFGRLVSFMARWQSQTSTSVVGIGVDDLTALGIDSTGLCTVFGTGAVAIYRSKANFINRSGRITNTNIQLRHLLHGWGYHFGRDSIIIPENALHTVVLDTTMTQKSIVLLSSQSAIDIHSRHSLVQTLTQRYGSTLDGICLISSSQSSINSLKRVLTTAGVRHLHTILTQSDAIVSLNTTLAGISKFWFADHTVSSLLGEKMRTHLNLSYIKQRIDSGGVVVAFSGGDVRFAGERMVSDNYTQRDAAYSRSIQTTQGFGLLKSTIVFPQIFQSDTYGENGYSSIPYFMMADSIHRGLFLHGNQTLIYEVEASGKSLFRSVGDAPVFVFTHTQNRYNFSVIRSYNDAPQNARQIAGFEKIKVTLIDTNSIMQVGENVQYVPLKTTTSGLITAFNTPHLSSKLSIYVYPNPATHTIHCGNEDIQTMIVLDLEGRVHAQANESVIEIGNLKSGMYILRTELKSGLIGFKKFQKL